MTFRQLMLLALTCGAAAAQGAPPTPRPLPQPQPPATVTATRNEPTPQEFTADKLARLKVPTGFTLKVMATGLGNARMLQVMPDGGIYLSRRAQNDVWYLKDGNGDGQIQAGERRQVAQNLTAAHGLAVRSGKLYVAGASTIWVMDIAADSNLSRPRVFADRLPEPGQHSARTIAWGPDGYLYASFGSQNNDAPTPNPEAAALLRISPDGKSREVYASGLRHTIGFGWQPVTGALYGFDQGSDWHGDNVPPEELNRLERGRNYGWPFCYGDKIVDPYVNSRAPGNITNAEYCAGTVGAVKTYTAHAAAIAATFYTAAQFPAAYRGDLFAAMRGSWNRSEPSGYEIVRADFDAAGQPQRIEPFVTGFVYEENGEWKQFGRVAGVATYTDGSLLFTDDQSGVLYRVLYTGGQ